MISVILFVELAAFKQTNLSIYEKKKIFNYFFIYMTMFWNKIQSVKGLIFLNNETAFFLSQLLQVPRDCKVGVKSAPKSKTPHKISKPTFLTSKILVPRLGFWTYQPTARLSFVSVCPRLDIIAPPSWPPLTFLLSRLFLDSLY